MKEITKNEQLFWKVYHNKYIRMVIWDHLSSMKLSYTSNYDIYLGNRVPFKFIRSLSWLSKRFAWSLLYDKLNSGRELLIKKSGIYRFLKNCKKDINLIKLLYEKHTEEMNQVDLILLSIQANNIIALELFFLDYKIQTQIHSIDMVYETGTVSLFGKIEKTFDFKFTTKYTMGIFKILKKNKFETVQYLLSKPDEYCLDNDMIEISTFFRFDEKTKIMILNYEKFNLLKIDGKRTLESIHHFLLPYHIYNLPEEERYQPFILPNSTYQLLNKFYTHLDLFKLSIKFNVLNGCYLLTSIQNFGKSNDISELVSYISVASIEFLSIINKFKQLNINVLPMLKNQEIINLFKSINISLNLDSNINDGIGIICQIKSNGFENQLKLSNRQPLPKPIEIEPFEFNGYLYRNNLKEIVRMGELKELIKLLDQGYGKDFTISDPLMSKILKYADLETIKKLSNRFVCYGYSFSKNLISNSLFLRIIDRGRKDVYLYFLSLLVDNKNVDGGGSENYNFKLDSTQVSKLSNKGDIEMIKFLFQLDFNYNNKNNNNIITISDTVEIIRKQILKETMSTAIRCSNIKLVKWLISPDNIFRDYINLSTIDSLSTIKNNNRMYLTHFYISLPFSSFYNTTIFPLTINQ